MQNCREDINQSSAITEGRQCDSLMATKKSVLSPGKSYVAPRESSRCAEFDQIRQGTCQIHSANADNNHAESGAETKPQSLLNSS